MPVTTTSQETIAMTGAGAPVTPLITTQPASQTVAAGQMATFLVAASGAAPLSYQWQKNGTAISGATSSTYVDSSCSDVGHRITVHRGSQQLGGECDQQRRHSYRHSFYRGTVDHDAACQPDSYRRSDGYVFRGRLRERRP